ncbi:hypothetical protein Pta02_11620 [Planobispora takensis]|uniref:Uncharacterized protein n=1 Tax=Planobispora takensis TaxID=1367882 RepID=A0A8J3WR45_9ACTN|nr:hypothetical protein Pta02_11620 [Planobispora takensis]
MPGTTGAGAGGTGVRSPGYGQAGDPGTGETGPGAWDPGRQGPGPEGTGRRVPEESGLETGRWVPETDRPGARAASPGTGRGPGADRVL